MRLDETKTGEILNFFHARLESGKNPFEQREKLTENLLRILRERYPLRGRISGVISQEIALNVGVRIGQRFRVLGTDWVLRVVSIRGNGTSTVQFGKGSGCAGRWRFFRLSRRMAETVSFSHPSYFFWLPI